MDSVDVFMSFITFVVFQALLQTVAECNYVLSLTVNEIYKRRRNLRKTFARRRHRRVKQQHIRSVQAGSVFVSIPWRTRHVHSFVRSSNWWKRIVQNHFREDDLIECFRMKYDTYTFLCDSLREELKTKHKGNYGLSPEKKVAIALYKLCSCCEYRVVAHQFGVSKATVHLCVYNVTKAINNILRPQFITMPDHVQVREVTYCFDRASGVPQVIGAIDGTHIPILPPSVGYKDYVNRKNWHSIVLQAVVDHHYLFRNVFCGIPGSNHDARVLKHSLLYKNATKLLPKVCHAVNGVKVPPFIIGDPAYPLLPWLITAHRDTTQPENESFNVYHSRARIVVENAFGRLKGRFRCLLKRSDIHYTFMPQVVSAFCVLQNIVELNCNTFLHQWLQCVEEAEVELPQPNLRRGETTKETYSGDVIQHAFTAYMAANYPLLRRRVQ